MKTSTNSSTRINNILAQNATESINSQRRRFMLNTALGASCLSLLPTALATSAVQPESLFFDQRLNNSQWQPVVWFNGLDRHLVSRHPNQPENIILHQFAGSLSASAASLKLDETVRQLLLGQTQPANPRLHQTQQQFFLTFCSGSSPSSMQGYVAVADQINGPYRLQRTAPLAAATELSLFDNQHGETYALISDGEMISVTPFHPQTQRSGKRTALLMSSSLKGYTANAPARVTSPVMCSYRGGLMLACVEQTGQQLLQLQATQLHGNWQLSSFQDINDIQLTTLAFDSNSQLWSASASSSQSGHPKNNVNLTPITSVQRA
ncbi:hypothetical protein [Neptunicella sp.]|uniref:hypothetical protein n=1 Tax=Neptunicella sp. TaxID=2125986 RepID=UPI003F6928FC